MLVFHPQIIFYFATLNFVFFFRIDKLTGTDLISLRKSFILVDVSVASLHNKETFSQDFAKARLGTQQFFGVIAQTSNVCEEHNSELEKVSILV